MDKNDDSVNKVLFIGTCVNSVVGYALYYPNSLLIRVSLSHHHRRVLYTLQCLYYQYSSNMKENTQ